MIIYKPINLMKLLPIKGSFLMKLMSYKASKWWSKSFSFFYKKNILNSKYCKFTRLRPAQRAKGRQTLKICKNL